MEQLRLPIDDEEKKSKPVIIAICGESASGKDTFLNKLMSRTHWYHFDVTNFPEYFEDCEIFYKSWHRIVSDTTRPPRLHEQAYVDYVFLSEGQFLSGIAQDLYFEWTKFNDWYYGIPKNRIQNDCVNVGVFNPDGIVQLLKRNDINLIIVRIKTNFITRLYRSIKRENKIKKEYFRRASTDVADFRKLQRCLDLKKYKYYIEINGRQLNHGVNQVIDYLKTLHGQF